MVESSLKFQLASSKGLPMEMTPMMISSDRLTGGLSLLDLLLLTRLLELICNFC